jgi:uncharacterized OsmC-like protein
MSDERNSTQHFAVTLTRHGGYQFLADFHEPGVPQLTVDERPPLGKDRGPTPTRLLAAAVGNCLSASLIYCLERAQIPVTDLDATVEGELVRNDRGRLRIGALKVKLVPRVGVDAARIERCVHLFEDYCVVTQSVREGIDVQVEVAPVFAGEPAGVPD